MMLWRGDAKQTLLRHTLKEQIQIRKVTICQTLTKINSLKYRMNFERNLATIKRSGNNNNNKKVAEEGSMEKRTAAQQASLGAASGQLLSGHAGRQVAAGRSSTVFRAVTRRSHHHLVFIFLSWRSQRKERRQREGIFFYLRYLPCSLYFDYCYAIGWMVATGTFRSGLPLRCHFP